MHAPSGAPIAVAYLLYFGTIGILLPFLPAYFGNLGLSAPEIGALLAISPAVTLVAPPLWGQLADRVGAARVLPFVTLGSALTFAPLLWASGFWMLAGLIAVYALFASATTTLIDSLALAHVARSGGAYARLRLFGSLGFVLSSTAVGLAATQIDRGSVAVAEVLLGVSFLWSLVLRRLSRRAAAPVPAPSGPATPTARPSRFAAWSLLRRREIRLLCIASTLHWIAGAPYHGAFALHAGALGLAPWVVGVSVALGVVAEMVVMFFYSRIAAGRSARALLTTAYLLTAVRWAGMAVADTPEVILALSLLHGFTFGVFYAGSVAYLARAVPPEQRASGQSLFAATSFGLGGLVGYVFAGLGFEALGGHGLFAAAVGVELCAALVVWRLPVSASVPRSSVALR